VAKAGLMESGKISGKEGVRGEGKLGKKDERRDGGGCGWDRDKR